MLPAVLDGVSRQGIYNAQLLSVQGWSEDLLRLKCTEGGAEFAVPIEWAQQNLRYGAAICYAAIQARTCYGTVALWDTTSRRFTRRHLVMGLSRATAATKVWLADKGLRLLAVLGGLRRAAP